MRYIIENGILDLPSIDEQIEMNIRKKYLAMHTHKIWETTDGKWCTYLPDKNKGRKVCKRKTREEVESEVISYWKQFDENPTVEEVFTEWNDRRLQREQIKASSHCTNKSIFQRFYKTMGSRKIKDISEPEWEDFLCDCIIDYKLSAKAFSDLKRITKGFLKRAKKRNLISMEVQRFFLELDVSDNDFKKRVIDEEKEVFFDDEAELIMNYIKGHIDVRNIGIALMFVTGIRVGELVTLKHSDFTDFCFQIKRTQTRYKNENNKYVCDVSDLPKTPAGYRTVFIPKSQSWIADKIKIINPFEEFIFSENGKRLTTEHIRNRLYRICDVVGVPRKSPHKIRKTYGSILLDNGVDNKTIEGQMGHTDITTTERFYHRNRRRLEQRQKIFDNIPEFMAK